MQMLLASLLLLKTMTTQISVNRSKNSKPCCRQRSSKVLCAGSKMPIVSPMIVAVDTEP